MEENKLPEKIFAVEYAGFWDLSPTDSYDLSVLHVLDYPNAEQIANEIAKRYNEYASLKAENDRLREALALICIHFPKDIMIDQMGEDFDKVGSLLSQPKEETK